VVAEYLIGQIKAGADVVQIFDSWAGTLTPEYYRVFSMPFLQKIVHRVKQHGAPIILFLPDTTHSIEDLADIGADVLSISWREDLSVIKKRVNGKVALQGNLDPCALFAPVERLRGEVKNVLEKVGSKTNHIFNLGHGILPQTPVEHAKALVETVKEESPKFHFE